MVGDDRAGLVPVGRFHLGGRLPDGEDLYAQPGECRHQLRQLSQWCVADLVEDQQQRWVEGAPGCCDSLGDLVEEVTNEPADRGRGAGRTATVPRRTSCYCPTAASRG